MTTADEYLYQILAREAVPNGISSPVRSVQATIMPTLLRWAGNYLLDVSPSGSFAKGTANRSGTDIDLFLSIHESVPNTLNEIYETLFRACAAIQPKRQNVSINVKVGSYDIDLVPGKKQNAMSGDHSLYRRRADTWTKTNVATHIFHVHQGGRQSETRVLKLWRNQKQLDFPSFYLELSVMAALAGRPSSLAANVMQVLTYLRDTFPSARVVDPANTNNVISDDLNAAQRAAIRSAAIAALGASNWNEIVR
ncbi:nucleotidyltransferase [Rhizobium johnstonii]|uniref:nucleotidyltransferase n=1 Tax=Rhizobium TaxID=379 RepID=UPI0010304F97|nr:nucleotidyltransferase [Rhizobium leguminosarum]TBH46094.1 nucleotidyltransferase [Rhizobium leguminosarum]